MAFGPLNLNLYKSSTRTTNDILTGGYAIGINWPKGPYIHSFSSNFYLSKDGIYQTLQKGCEYFLWARFLALLEVLLYLITLPVMIVVYLVLMLVSLCAAIPLTFTLPFSFNVCCNQFMGVAITTNRAACGVFWIVFLESFLSILYGLVYCITSPFQIIVPEFTQLLLKQHTWGTTPFAYF